jgi:GTP-binding protein
MVDGVCLVVDAAEGPMTQTKYVLSRAIAMNLQPVFVLNKCDRPDALQKLDSGETETALADLLESLGATEDMKKCSTLYASARSGWIVEEDPFQAMEVASGQVDSKEFGMEALLDVFVRDIPEPAVEFYGSSDNTVEVSQPGDFFAEDKFSLAAITVGFDQYLGRTCTGRITSGSIQTDDVVQMLPRDGSTTTSEPTAISGVFVYAGIERRPYEERAYAGDCVTLTGVPEKLAVGDTLTSAANPIMMPIETPPLAPPTLSMDFGANNGPLAGKEGTNIASSKIRNRLIQETDNNVTLKVEKSETDSEKTVVFARGELQLGILVEQMRREGYEMIISPPRVLTYHDEETGKEMEPFEEVVVDVDAEFTGLIVSGLTGDRKGTLIEMNETSADGKTRLVLHVPTRGLLGFASEIATLTRGSAVVNHYFLEDREHVGSLGHTLYKAKLVSNSAGKATSYSLATLSARGTLFIAPGEEVYPGMVIGENAKTGPDLEVNCVREKEKTNMRTHSSDGIEKIAPPKRMSFEEMVGYMAEDEVIEVTPKSIRLRKVLLDSSAREKAARDKAKKIRATKQQ